MSEKEPFCVTLLQGAVNDLCTTFYIQNHEAFSRIYDAAATVIREHLRSNENAQDSEPSTLMPS